MARTFLTHGPGTPWRDWYQLNRWRRRAKAQLRAEPLCRMCAKRGMAVPATIADHVAPHRGDWNAFWLNALQSLCKTCHDKGKHFVEARGYDPTAVGADGWPLDPKHPANQQPAGQGCTTSLGYAELRTTSHNVAQKDILSSCTNQEQDDEQGDGVD